MTATTTEAMTAPRLSDIAGRRIRGLRSELGWSQKTLVARAGMNLSGGGMSDRETGVKPIPVDELPAFAAALGTSVAYLMGLTDDRSRPLEGAASDALRACRDSNPKPSDLSPARERAARAWGLSLEPVIGTPAADLSASVIRFPVERRTA